MGRTTQTSKNAGKKQKRARSERAGTCIQPYRVEKIIRQAMPAGTRLGAEVAEFLAAAADHFVFHVATDAKEEAGGDKKQIDVVHIARVLKDSSKPYHGIVPPVANVHALDPVSQKEAQVYANEIETAGEEMEVGAD